MKAKSLIKNRLLSIIFSLLGLTSIFLGGFFSNDAKFEKVSEYAASVVKDATKNGKYCAITIGDTEESGKIADCEHEFHQLYGLFKQTKITFASTINADKKHNIILGDSFSDNLSFLYVGPVGTREYKGHFKHYVSPMEVMFKDERYYNISKYVAYISQTHADNILDSNGVPRDENGNFTEADYKSLLKQIIPVSVDGEVFDFVIQNIYLQSNYYYKGLNDVMGDFLICSYYLPNDLRSDQENMYFMSEYAYQNAYFMRYINDVYPSKKYVVRVNHYNLTQKIDDDYLLSFYYSDEFYGSDNLTIALFALGILFVALSLLMIFVRRLPFGSLFNFDLIINLSILFLPYLIFKFLWLITGNVAFLNETASKIYCFTTLSYIFVVLIGSYLYKCWEKSKKRNLTDYDINI